MDAADREVKGVLAPGECGTDERATVHVRLVDEPVPVWRPVEAAWLREGVARIALGQIVPPDECWEFQPGDLVTTVPRGAGGDAIHVAERRLGEVGEPNHGSARTRRAP